MALLLLAWLCSGKWLYWTAEREVFIYFGVAPSTFFAGWLDTWGEGCVPGMPLSPLSQGKFPAWGGKSRKGETAFPGAWCTGGSGGCQRRERSSVVPKRDCVTLMWHLAGIQCGGCFSLTCVWSYILPMGLSFLHFPCFALCPEKSKWQQFWALGLLWGSPAWEERSRPFYCHVWSWWGHGAVLLLCSGWEICRKKRGKAVLCSLPPLWGNIWSGALCFPQM